MNKTQVKILVYLQGKARKGEKIPSLQDLADTLNINYYTLSDNLIKLRKLGKIEYKGGKIINVYTENCKGMIVPTKTQQHKNKYSVKELEEKYDKCVKEIICEYISKIDASLFTSDAFSKDVSSITNITNNLKSKLFK